MNYKIYIVKTDESTKQLSFIEAEFNYGCGCETKKEAYKLIEHQGDLYIHYTILPYICMFE